LYIDEICDLYRSPSTVKKEKSRRLQWAENMARTAEIRNSYKILVRKPLTK